MPSPYSFQRVAIRLLDPDLYRRVIRAYQHRTGLRLIHQKFFCHNARDYHRYGAWLLCDGDYIVARKMYIGTAPKVGPLQWADAKARGYIKAGRPQPNRPLKYDLAKLEVAA